MTADKNEQHEPHQLWQSLSLRAQRVTLSRMPTQSLTVYACEISYEETKTTDSP